MASQAEDRAITCDSCKSQATKRQAANTVSSWEQSLRKPNPPICLLKKEYEVIDPNNDRRVGQNVANHQPKLQGALALLFWVAGSLSRCSGSQSVPRLTSGWGWPWGLGLGLFGFLGFGVSGRRDSGVEDAGCRAS